MQKAGTSTRRPVADYGEMLMQRSHAGEGPVEGGRAEAVHEAKNWEKARVY